MQTLIEYLQLDKRANAKGQQEIALTLTVEFVKTQGTYIKSLCKLSQVTLCTFQSHILA